MSLKLFVAKIYFLASINFAFSSNWWYNDEHGPGVFAPAQWGQVNPNCDGLRQSPIDISVINKRAARPKNKISFGGYDEVPASILYKNDGHGFAATESFTSLVQPNITGGPLGSDFYALWNFHMHWPSEHKINGKHSDAEVHLVHYNLKYGSFAAAAAQSDGLAVIGVLFDLENKTEEARSPFKSANAVKEYGSPNYIDSKPSFSLKFFVDASGESLFYSYPGSLTTPTCNEAVTWFVAKKSVAIYPEELEILRHLKDDHGEEIEYNNRPVQPLNGRIIKRVYG